MSQEEYEQAVQTLRSTYKQDSFEDDLNNLITFIRQNNLPAVQYLIENKQVDPNQVNAKGASPLSAAIAAEMVEIVRYLLNHGARKDFILGSHDNREYTAVDTATNVPGQAGTEIRDILNNTKTIKLK